MKGQEINKLSVDDLKKQLLSETEKLAKMKIGHKVTPLENPIQIRDVRKQIARLNTELRKREIQA
ncbi:50S ribosomal protein L29 [Fluviicola sp.]|uniref:50S ribosomal protein L29 n=1 Tax=Fluviicola sp. TaxID=1917219 RepID=UPI0031DB68DA